MAKETPDCVSFVCETAFADPWAEEVEYAVPSEPLQLKLVLPFQLGFGTMGIISCGFMGLLTDLTSLYKEIGKITFSQYLLLNQLPLGSADFYLCGV